MKGENMDLETHKRELLARSEGYRQRLLSDVRDVAGTVEWVPKTFSTLRFVTPVLLMAAPAAAFAVGRWALGRVAAPVAPARARLGILGKAMMAFRIFQQVKPLWDGYRKTRVL